MTHREQAAKGAAQQVADHDRMIRLAREDLAASETVQWAIASASDIVDLTAKRDRWAKIAAVLRGEA